MSSEEDTGVVTAQFVNITGAETDDALDYLENANWKLEDAIQEYYSKDVTKEMESSVNNDQSPSQSEENDKDLGQIQSTSSRRGAQGEAAVRAPIPVKTDVLYGPVFTRRGTQIARPNHGIIPTTLRNCADEWAAIDPKTCMLPPRDKLAALYRPPTDICLVGTFTHAKDVAMAQDKWLLANVQTSREFSSHSLNRDTWAHEAVKETLKNSFVFWQVYDTNEEGNKVKTFYKEPRSPITILLNPHTGEKKKLWQGMVTPERLLEYLLNFIDVSPLQAAAETPSKRPRDAALVAAGEVKGENFEKPPSEAECSGDENAMSTEHSGTNLEPVSLSRPAEPCAGPVPEPHPEPLSEPTPTSEAFPLPEEPPVGTDTCRVAIRLPTGERVQRRFYKTDPVKLLEMYCYGLLPEAAAGRGFKLNQPMPGTPSVDLDSSKTLEQLGLSNSCLIWVWL